MIANEMRNRVLLLFDKQFEFDAPYYDDKQISSNLTIAQETVFRHNYTINNRFKDGFENSELRKRALEQLIKPASLTNSDITVSSEQEGVHPEGTFYDLPTDFFLAIEEAATTAEITGEVTIVPVEHDFYNKNIKNPYKKPYKNLVWRMDISRVDHGEDGGDSMTGRTAKRTELIVGNKSTYPITEYRLRYLSILPEIVCDVNTPSNQRHCILDESIQDDIIREVVKIMTAAVKPEEYQIAVNEQQNNEN